MACGKAFSTGDTEELDDLHARLRAGEIRLTRDERRVLRDFHLRKPPWRRKRGEWRTHGGLTKREAHAEITAQFVLWMNQIRETVRADPNEQAEMRRRRKSGKKDVLEERVVDLATELMTERGEEPFPRKKLLKFLHVKPIKKTKTTT